MLDSVSSPTARRLAMRAHGYSPLPLNGKAPKIASWQKRSDATDREIIAWARVRPAETNTGLLTRNNPAFDIDILSSAEVADAVADLIAEELRDRGVLMVRFGRRPKRAIVCRTASPFKKIKVELDSFFTDPETGEIRHDAIEILGDGQQLACFGEHPDTKQPYEWLDGSPADVPASELPSIAEADARAIVDKVVAMLGERFGIKPRSEPKATYVSDADAPVAEAKTDAATAWGAAALRRACEMIAGAGSGSQEATLNGQCYGIGQLVAGGERSFAEGKSKPRAAPEADGTDPEPVEFKLRVKGDNAAEEAEPSAGDDADRWAAWEKAAKVNFDRLPADQRRAHEDMTRIYVRARLANGGEHPRYTEKVAAELGPQYREAFLKIDLDLFNLVEAKSTALQTIDGITVGKDADWTDVDGVLGEMRDWILATSPFPNRRMAVMAAFATLSGTTARHLYTPTGLGLGLVMAMLARTTVGKDAPLTAVAKILYAAGLGHMSQPAKSFTVSGFEQGLINSSGACVATGDEIGENLLARILSKKAMSHETMMKTFIMEATGQQDDSAPFALTKRSRNGSRDAAPIQTLDGILFTMLGASTPKRFFETLSNGNVTDGLLGRVLTINADPKPEENEAPFIRVPDSVIAALRAIGETGYTGKLNLGGMPIYDRVRAQWTPEGKARYDLLGKRIDALLATEPPYEELYGRAKANALVLATLLAISRDHIAPMVDAPDIDRGAAMVMESIAATIAGLGDATGGTPYGEMVRDIETYVRKRKTITVRDIGNAVRGYSKKDRMAALTDMEELGRVTISRYDTNGMLSILPKSAVVWIA